MYLPSGTIEQMRLVGLLVSTSGAVWLDLYKNNTITSYGTSVATHNLNMASNNVAQFKVYHTPTATPGTLIFQTVIPGGTSVRAIGAYAELGEYRIIPQDLDLLLILTNKSETTADIGVKVLWIEE